MSAQQNYGFAALQRNFAYEHCVRLIESSCVGRFDAETGLQWFDLDDVDVPVKDCDAEAAYLDSLGLLLHDEKNLRLICILDEDSEPSDEVAA